MKGEYPLKYASTISIVGLDWSFAVALLYLCCSSAVATPFQNGTNVSDLIHQCIKSDTQRAYPVACLLLHFYRDVM